MNIKEFNKSLVGEYFIDKYDLDSEDSYLRVKHIYRVNRVENDKLICTKISICYSDKKKTSERSVVEAKISDVEVESKVDNKTFEVNNMFLSMVKVGKRVWEEIAKELVDVVVDNTGVKINLQQYCKVCENKDSEECRFCCKEGDKEPTQFKENNV